MLKLRVKQLLELFIIILILGVFYYYDNYKEEKIQYRKTEKTVKIDEKDNFKIYFLDVGQADSILITNNNENLLIDAGNNEDGKKIVDYFKSLGITSFKYVVGTHAHEDHIGGMDDIIRNFNIEHFLMPDEVTTTKTFEDVLDALYERNISFETPNINDSFTLSESKIEVLYVGSDEEDLNNSSIVLKLTYKNTKYLFMADATNEVERMILDNDLSCDVLKVGHHGSQYSTSAHFLKAAYPKYAIISVGKDNEYGHPKKITINKLERIKTKVYRTDIDGTIILKSNGKDIYFETEKTYTNGG